MSGAIEVLKEMRSLFNESNSWEVTQERDNALYQALLALEKQEKLKLWLEKKIQSRIDYIKILELPKDEESIDNAKRELFILKEVLELMK